MQAVPTNTLAEPVQVLREFIVQGNYEPGDRLPAERELISSLGVTRNSLRRGLDALEREGVIWRQVGKGTFISSPEANASTAGLAEISHRVTPIQMMRARLSLEPAIAREAAVNASEESIRKINTARDRTLNARSWDSYESNDVALHRVIAEASGNILLLSLFDHMNEVQRAVTWGQVIRKTDRPPKDHTSYREHEEIVAAIERRDPFAAQQAMQSHLSSVSKRLFGDV